MHSKVILKRYGSVKLVLLFRTVTSLRRGGNESACKAEAGRIHGLRDVDDAHPCSSPLSL